MQHHLLAGHVLRESPGYGHANLILSYTRRGDKRTASEHYAKLCLVDRAVYELVSQNPTLSDFFDNIGTPHFFQSAQKKGDL